ncbi:hypothetical protein BDZ89DRAFT_390762, partial [Hymenopellis radicata]
MLEPGKPMYADYATAKETNEKIAALDAHPNVLTLLAHDISLIGEYGIDLFSASVDDWRAKGLEEMLVWGFMKEGHKGWRFGSKLKIIVTVLSISGLRPHSSAFNKTPIANHRGRYLEHTCRARRRLGRDSKGMFIDDK